MEKKSSKNFFLIKLGAAFKFVSQHLIVGLWLILLLSIIELTIIWQTKGLPDNYFLLLVIAWSKDLLFWLRYIWIFYLVFIPLIMLIQKPSMVVLKVVMMLFFIIHLLLVNYFNTALVPLGADIYGYSLKDIQETLNASGGINLTSIIILFIVVGILVFIIFYAIKKIQFSRFVAITIPILSIALSFSEIYSINSELELESEFANDLASNKSFYFYNASLHHFFNDNDVQEIDLNKIAVNHFTYVDVKNYPFLHKENTKDILSPYFNRDSIKPNIVIILVEGLGRSFSNEGAVLGSFTPFLDSLSQKSLYWENFLSQGGRTFAALPSVLGSLPFAKNGFLEMNDKMPKHLSLLNLLQYNGYKSSFYYGGDAGFDNMASYLKMNNINKLNDEKTFPSNYRKIPTVNNFSWGYEDSELFRYYLTSEPIENDPKINVILTVSTHNPFKINDANKFNVLFEKRLNQLAFDDKKKNIYRNYKDQYSSILYTDDALKTFFKNYQAREDFKNTVFIITGDHRMPEIPMSSKIDRYHVPFMIYSPLLKKQEKFKVISSHFDIAPSILAFLKNSYGIKTPQLSSWIGEGLKTDANSNKDYSFPIMQNKTDLVDFVSGAYHLNEGNLYILNPGLDEERIDNKPDINNKLKAQFNLFKARNTEIINGKPLMPDSIIAKYTLPLK